MSLVTLIAPPAPSVPHYSLTCAKHQTKSQLYHSGLLMYVYVCLQMRCFISRRERRREGKGEKEGSRGRGGGKEKERRREGEGEMGCCVYMYVHCMYTMPRATS